MLWGDFLGVVDDAHNFFSIIGEFEKFEEAGQNLAVADAGENLGLEIEGIEGVEQGGNDVGVVGEGKFAATDDVDV